MHNPIRVISATTHNLKNVSVEIPKHQVVVFTGVSGSGKSSLVFDTIYTEAQRQLVDTFSSFARRRLPKLSRPPVEAIENLATAIVIDQKRLGTTMRSTVGTATEIATYLRLLFSRCGEPAIGPSFLFSFNHPEGMCTECRGLGVLSRVNTDMLLDRSKSIREGAIEHPEYKIGGWSWRELTVIDLFDCDTPLQDWADDQIDKLLYTEIIPVTKPHGAGTYAKNFEGIARRLERLRQERGAAPADDGKRNAYERYFVESVCDACGGTRLAARARSVSVNGRTIDDLSAMELVDLLAFLTEVESPVAAPLLNRMMRILEILVEVGVGYLSLDRAVATLSGGESQRVKMARQMDCDLTELLYILDEPSIGLHPRDIDKLIAMIHGLKNRGNSILVVEHDQEIIRNADWIVDIGPRAGSNGGNVLYSGNLDGLKGVDSPTSTAIFGTVPMPSRSGDRRSWKESYTIVNARARNLKGISVVIPRAAFTCVTGVAGSGKSTLIHEVFCSEHPEAVVVDQKPVGRSSRSNPATYIGIFDQIRKEFAGVTGASPSLFSFNSEGACPKCSGLGYLNVEMSFLDSVTMTCDQCRGERYTQNVLDLRYRGKSIFEVLSMTVDDALPFFSGGKITSKLKLLVDVGLGYVQIGQPLSTLSGGEAQRIKLATELHKEGNLYVMDEPTTGLHPSDIGRLVAIINRLVDGGNSVVVIEHNLDVISLADWVIDLGPGGGKNGGKIMATGTPEDVAREPGSYTGRFLRGYLSRQQHAAPALAR